MKSEARDLVGLSLDLGPTLLKADISNQIGP